MARPLRCIRTFSSTARASQTTTSFNTLMSGMRADQSARPNPNPKPPSNAFRPRSFNPQTTAPSSTPNAAIGVVNRVREAALARQQQTREEVAAATERADMDRQLTRRWQSGEVYAPHDLSGVEMAKWRRPVVKGKMKKDVVDVLGLGDIDYKNFSIMSEYMTETGRIKHSRETGLRPVNQRKMARAMRRAIGVGLMPSVHRHPEILAPIIRARRNVRA